MVTRRGGKDTDICYIIYFYISSLMSSCYDLKMKHRYHVFEVVEGKGRHQKVEEPFKGHI